VGAAWANPNPNPNSTQGEDKGEGLSPQSAPNTTDLAPANFHEYCLYSVKCGGKPL